MREDRERVLTHLASESLRLALTAGFWFGGAWLETGSLIAVAETTGFFVGVGALGAGLALAVAPAIVVCAIAVAVGDEKTVSDISRGTDELLPLMSPGALTLMPVSPFVTPHDPTLFARGAGPALDLLTGVLSPKALDRLGASAAGFAGMPSWKADVVSLGNYYVMSQSSGSPTSGHAPTGGLPVPSPSQLPEDDPRTGGGDSPFNFPMPGEGDSSGFPSHVEDVYAPAGYYMDLDMSATGSTSDTGGGDNGSPANSAASTETTGSENSDDQGSAPTGEGGQDEGSGTGSSTSGGNEGGDGSGGGRRRGRRGPRRW